MSRRYRNRGWPRYVSVEERRAQAERQVMKLREGGQNIQPIEISGRTITRSFWGKAWCEHLESFGDYSNRLPRGRSYVRNGAVCHLDIAKGRVDAMVAGSDMYNVEVKIATLNKKKWSEIKKRCTGRIGSLIELLQGKLSDEIMKTVTDRSDGLFPLQGQITYSCDCPDWAKMCKHVSAVMYGIGARLDEQPELLFLLRGVDHEELVSESAAAEEITSRRSRRSRRRNLSGTDVESVFGVELDHAIDADADEPRPKRKPSKRKKRTAQSTSQATKRKTSEAKAFKPTAKSVLELRQRLGMSKAEFAREVGVSAATIANWEKSTGGLSPQARNLDSLTRLNNAVAE
jgi:uncharacterized Zn finger protein